METRAVDGGTPRAGYIKDARLGLVYNGRIGL
jgi:hypothetical protein